MFVLDLDYKVHIKGHGWKGSWMKMVCPCFLLLKEKEVLSMSTNVGNPKCNISGRAKDFLFLAQQVTWADHFHP